MGKNMLYEMTSECNKYMDCLAEEGLLFIVMALPKAFI